MSDDLIRSKGGYEYSLKDALRRNPTIIVAGDDISAVALARIEALEAKLAKAVEALHQIAGDKDFADDPWGIARTTLAELTGAST